jgi:WW domain
MRDIVKANTAATTSSTTSGGGNPTDKFPDDHRDEEYVPDVTDPVDNAKENWRVYATKEGLTYFYNIRKKKTTWYKPACLIDEEKKSQSVTPAKKKHQVIKGKNNWACTVDEKTGLVYYFHTITKETTWEKPLAFEN